MFGRHYGVTHEHGDGHGADAAGHRGNATGLFLDFVKIDIAAQFSLA